MSGSAGGITVGTYGGNTSGGYTISDLRLVAVPPDSNALIMKMTPRYGGKTVVELVGGELPGPVVPAASVSVSPPSSMPLLIWPEPPAAVGVVACV